MVASKPTRPDFIGIGMIARVPAELIDGAANRKHRSLGPRFSRVGRVRGLSMIGFYCEDRERKP